MEVARGNLVEIVGMKNEFLVSLGNLVEIVNLGVFQPFVLRRRGRYITFLECVK